MSQSEGYIRGKTKRNIRQVTLTRIEMGDVYSEPF
jgi:hypothetical protein